MTHTVCALILLNLSLAHDTAHDIIAKSRTPYTEAIMSKTTDSSQMMLQHIMVPFHRF